LTQEGYSAFKAVSRAPAPVVNVTNVQEKAEAGEFGKFLVKDYENISKRAEVAQKSLSAIDANLNILNKGFETGFGTETKAAAAKVLSALGVEKANMFATNAQVFEAKAAEAILETLRQQLGPQTDADAKRVTLTGAQLANTTNSNKFLLDVAKVTNKRELEQRNFYNNWRKTNGSFDGAEEAWIAGEGGKSIFDRPELKKYVSSTLDAPATQIPTTNASVAPTARPIPPAAVQMLLSGKGTDAQFDAQFGAGAAKRARGSK
jgi:NADH dehydrogenase/NADH:ubiquinone oxidoreductase subunit G